MGVNPSQAKTDYGYPFKCYVPPLTAALDDDDSDDSGVIY